LARETSKRSSADDVALVGHAGAAAILLLLVVKLRGGGRDDLMAPPRRKPRRLSGEELDSLTALVGRGE
jgi:hypothetical protein